MFYPLSEASGRSMAKMKLIAPRMKALQETYKDDRQKLGAAMMELYKKEKVNPASGCLPQLVQLPVFLAFYWVLLESVEMRQAPFFGWIQDLSSRDPFFILPLIMAGAMFLQYKLQPTPADPVQAKVFMILPIVMSVTFAFFPAGLVLYWVTNTLLTIAQQWNINRRIEATGAARELMTPRHHRRRRPRHPGAVAWRWCGCRRRGAADRAHSCWAALLPAPRSAHFSRWHDAAGELIDIGPRAVFPGAAFLHRRSTCWSCRAMAAPSWSKPLLERIVQLGARRARPGEFSERAFLNDKIDLAQAEAIADLIDAGSRRAAQAAMRSLQGEFSAARERHARRARSRLRVYVEAAIDFPEEEIDFLASRELRERLEDVRSA